MIHYIKHQHVSMLILALWGGADVQTLCWVLVLFTSFFNTKPKFILVFSLTLNWMHAHAHTQSCHHDNEVWVAQEGEGHHVTAFLWLNKTWCPEAVMVGFQSNQFSQLESESMLTSTNSCGSFKLEQEADSLSWWQTETHWSPQCTVTRDCI